MIIALIPCRLESKRLKKKALLRLENIPVITHVLKRSLLCKYLDKVVVCTDSNKIIAEVKKNKGLYFKSKKKTRKWNRENCRISHKQKNKIYYRYSGR